MCVCVERVGKGGGGKSEKLGNRISLGTTGPGKKRGDKGHKLRS